ncbi:MAG TPA: PBP1A family penicillin-binding protein [Paenibacillaceae bacterium]
MGKAAPRGKPRRGASVRRGRKVGTAFLWVFYAGLFIAVCVVLGYLLIILNGERILRENENRFELAQATVITDRDGRQVTKLYVAEGNRDYVEFKDIPELVRQAFIVTEDRRFYEHRGVDFWSIGRALVKDLIAGDWVEGGSTITQQLAKNLFLTSDKTLFRKATEASIALALENHRTKDQILELYLNRIYFGKGQYGIKTAAKFYFNKDLKDLELWEIATLAGIPKAPNVYNPLADPEKSKQRRAVVLDLMAEAGIVTPEEAEKAKKVEYDPKRAQTQSAGTQYPTYADYVLDEAVRVTGLNEDRIMRGGYTIVTAIDIAAQQAMEKAFADDDHFEKSGDGTSAQGAMVILDQHTGEITAMVGGRDYAVKGWNRVTKRRQPGSSFKPIASYGPALETGKWFPWSTLRDDKRCYDNGKYCPTDSNRVKYIGPVSMSRAVKESRNQPAVWLLNEIGVGAGVEFARRLGIELAPEDRNLAIALGGLTSGVTPLEMARAYAAFANGGFLPEPHTILEIRDSSGKTVYKYKEKEPERVMKAETSYYMTQLLLEVVKPGGTGTRAAIQGRQVAGKTGTTQLGIPGVKDEGNRDVWFVGYTPEYTAAVWMGYDRTDEKHYLQKGSGQAAALFSAVMSEALKNKEKRSFPKPEGIEKKEELAPVTGLEAEYMPLDVLVKLSWQPSSAKDVVYRIYRKAEGLEESFTLLAETAEPAFYDLAIFPEMTYVYYVTVYDAAARKESPPSEQVSVYIETELPEIIIPEEPGEGGEPPGEGLPESPPAGEEGPGEGTPESPPAEGETPPAEPPAGPVKPPAGPTEGAGPPEEGKSPGEETPSVPPGEGESPQFGVDGSQSRTPVP